MYPCDDINEMLVLKAYTKIRLKIILACKNPLPCRASQRRSYTTSKHAQISPADLYEAFIACSLPSVVSKAHLQVESLIRESANHQPSEGNYSWLKTRHKHYDFSKDLESFKPMVMKMTSESCASIAVKLDNLTEGHVTTTDILANFKRLLLEEDNMQLIDENVKRARETKNVRKRNRVHPELGAGRQPVVSFILDK